MLKSISIIITTLIISATGASAFELCNAKVSSDFDIADRKEGLIPQASFGLSWTLGASACKKEKAEAAQAEYDAREAKADAISAELELVKVQRENEEQSLDNLIKMVKVYDELVELCGKTKSKAICFKANKVALEIAESE